MYLQVSGKTIRFESEVVVFSSNYRFSRQQMGSHCLETRDHRKEECEKKGKVSEC